MTTPSLNSVRFAARTLPPKSAVPTPSAQPAFGYAAQAPQFGNIPADTSTASAMGRVRFGNALRSAKGDAIVERLIRHADRLGDVSYQELPGTGRVIKAELGGAEYTVTSGRKKILWGVTLRQNTVTVKAPGTEAKTASLSSESVADRLVKAVSPKIESRYGLGEGLDATKLLIHLADLYNQDKLGLTRLEPSDLEPYEVDIKAISGAGKAVLPDGMEVILIGSDSDQGHETHILIKKPGSALQLLAIDSYSEQAAGELLEEKFMLNLQRDDIKEQEESIQERQLALAKLEEELAAGSAALTAKIAEMQANTDAVGQD